MCVCESACEVPSKDHLSVPRSRGVQCHAVNKGLGGVCRCGCAHNPISSGQTAAWALFSPHPSQTVCM